MQCVHRGMALALGLVLGCATPLGPMVAQEDGDDSAPWIFGQWTPVPGDPSPRAPPLGQLVGRVVDLDGVPIHGVELRTDQGVALSDADGRFEVVSDARPVWIKASHPSYLPRTRAARPGEPVLIRLTPDDGETISIHFGGDTMAGRRYYDPNEDGDTRDGLISVNPQISEFAALLDGVRPLLANADLSLVNLESPLTPEAWVDPTQARPAGFHPTKDYVFASHPNLVPALKDAGIDLVGIGNNHMYDFLEPGISGTLTALGNAGLGHFGAGFTESAAWEPLVLSRRGQSLAFLGCTSISGRDQPLSYVADDLQAKGGAADCSSAGVRRSLQATAPHDNRVVMFHGGYEYQSLMSKRIQDLSNLARDTGATLVINHHPHVVGGFQWNGTNLVAATLGNFLFDQTVWRTLPSYLLAVHLRHGQVVRAYAEPLLVENYRPRGLVGDHARYVARQAAAEAGPFLLESGAMELDVRGQAVRRDTPMAVDGGTGTLYALGADQWISAFTGEGQIRLGRDLLWIGDFEDLDVDADRNEQALWRQGATDLQFGPDYAYAGEAGVRLYRDHKNRADLVLNQLYRITLDPGTEVTLVGQVRSFTGARVTAQLGWYPDMRGTSNQQTQVTLALEPGPSWRTFRLDAVAPSDAIATGLLLKLPPPNPAEMGETSVDFDDLRLIAWAPDGTAFSRRFDHARVTGKGDLTLSQEVLPGGEDWFSAPRLEPLAPTENGGHSNVY